MTKKMTTVLKELILSNHQRKQILIRPTVATALQAKMVEAVGFEALSISGANACAQILGLPDAGLITMTEVVDNVQHVCNAVKIPVMSDCDTGFGNAINVRRTVQSLIQAGAAGIQMEDQKSPKRCGFVKGKEVISLEEAVGKYRAAVDVRNELDPDFIIMARTDARTAVGGSLEEAIKRANAYREAGVDVIYLEAFQSREEIKKARAAIDGPLVCSTRGVRPLPRPTAKELQEMGICIFQGIMFFKVGNAAMLDMLVTIKQRGPDAFMEWEENNKEHPMAALNQFDLVGFPQVIEWEKKYLPPEDLSKYDKSWGAYDPRSRGSNK